MPAKPDIIKLFHEEPFFLEPLPPEDDPDARRRSTEFSAIDALLPGDFAEHPEPRSEDTFSEDALHRPRPYYRSYLAGTDLARSRVGATALSRPDVWTAAVAQVFAQHAWWYFEQGEVVAAEVSDHHRLLLEVRNPIAVAAEEPFAEPLRQVSTRDRRHLASAAKRLLDGAEAVLLPEPAHHGHDWSILATAPVRELLVSALQEHLEPGTRIFVAPYQKARTEERFYFEQWALAQPPDWVEELQPRV